MKIEDIPEFIREKVIDGKYQIKLHTLQRINERGIIPYEIKEVLLNCEVIENYPDDERGHSCLVSGMTEDNRTLHIVCGLSEDNLWIITIYEPSLRYWESPTKRRKKK